MNIIFLDVDGVLNIMGPSYSSFKQCRSSNVIEYHLVRRLEHIIERTNAHIVLSSSWLLKDFKECMRDHKFKFMDRILPDRTNKNDVKYPGLIDNHDRYLISQKGTGRLFYKYRGDQIAEWLFDHEGKVDKYIIIDDEIQDIIDLSCTKFPSSVVVEVDMKEGLTDIKCEEIIIKMMNWEYNHEGQKCLSF